MSVNLLIERLSVIAYLVRFNRQLPGRTAVMKLCYFLQTLRHVPLKYDFRLYSYGPFDSELLSDIQTAESLKVIDSEVRYFSGGYAYELKCAEDTDKTLEIASEFIKTYKKDLDWALQHFGRSSAGELELASTIVYVYKEKPRDEAHLAKLVEGVKPRFAEMQIVNKIKELKELGFIYSEDGEE